MKTRITAALTVLLILAALTGCGNVGPDDMAAGELQQMTADKVEEASWQTGTETGTLTEDQLRELVAAVNQAGETGIKSAASDSSGDGLRLKLKDGNLWTLSPTGTGDQVLISMEANKYTGLVKSQELSGLLSEILLEQ